MWGLSAEAAVYVHVEPVDGRKGINGLVALVEQSLKLDVFMTACFVFRPRRRDRVKILYWDRNGFWLCHKRLERDRFIWPRGDEACVTVTMTQLNWLLSGYDLSAMRGHQALHYRRGS
jgi:transposase